MCYRHATVGLARTCAACGAKNAAGMIHCHACGALLDDPHEADEERRLAESMRITAPPHPPVYQGPTGA